MLTSHVAKRGVSSGWDLGQSTASPCSLQGVKGSACSAECRLHAQWASSLLRARARRSTVLLVSIMTAEHNIEAVPSAAEGEPDGLQGVCSPHPGRSLRTTPTCTLTQVSRAVGGEMPAAQQAACEGPRHTPWKASPSLCSSVDAEKDRTKHSARGTERRPGL